MLGMPSASDPLPVSVRQEAADIAAFRERQGLPGLVDIHTHFMPKPVLDSEWGESQPDTDAQNAYLEGHDWTDYGSWFLGRTVGANPDTKGGHAFVFGDFRRIHRSGLIACVYRASEWHHKKVELAAHRLLQELDKAAGIGK